MSGIVRAATYLPHRRLERVAIGAGRGTRSVASFDEDSTSMAVEAARRALDSELRATLDSVQFVTTSPAYADRTNATAIHAALDLPHRVGAYDHAGAVRSVLAAIRAADDAAARGLTTLVVAGDIRVGLPGSADERDGGDAAAAVVFGTGQATRAEIVSSGVATAEFLDRWRIPGQTTSRVWEERFGEVEYVPLAEAALQDALKSSGSSLGDLDHLVVTGLHSRAVASFRRAVGVDPDVLHDDLSEVVGTSGAAHPLLTLVDVLERARPGQLIALLSLADGADCILLRAGSLAGSRGQARAVAEQLPGRPIAYNDVLVWRGLLQRDTPRRPDPERPAAPPSSRNAAWKFGFVGSRCTVCGCRHLPPERVCLSCRAIDRMQREPFADRHGTIVTFAIDNLALSVAPPVVVAVIDLDGGGRVQCELADVDPAAVAVGDRVEMTFRRLHTTADGVHNYHWKARPTQQGAA